MAEYAGAGTDEAKKEVKQNETDKFLAALFLRNTNYERYGELLVEYCKAYANSEERYPKNIERNNGCNAADAG